ncbi:hypothetical protein DFP78_1383, partial [Photobacterium lutimaris]
MDSPDCQQQRQVMEGWDCRSTFGLFTGFVA